MPVGAEYSVVALTCGFASADVESGVLGLGLGGIQTKRQARYLASFLMLRDEMRGVVLLMVC